MAVVQSSPIARGVAALAALALLGGCTPGPTPTPTSSQTAGPTGLPASAAPTVQPSPTAAAPGEFPLAVVTGLTNNKAVVTIDELKTLAKAGSLVLPCGVELVEPALTSARACVQADQIAATVQGAPKTIALLPPGLVEPATKVLAFAGDGPFGLFGPDLFGAPASRALPYPLTARLAGTEAKVDPAWFTVDATKVWTLNSVGSLCADRGGAKQAVTLGKGWDWVFGGGTAKYKGPPSLNPNPPPGVSRQLYVRPVETGNDGATGRLVSSADLSLGNHKCPILPTKDWHPSDQAHGLSVPEDVLPRWKDVLGLDAVYLPADHQSDRGVRGIKSTLTLLDKHGFQHTGLGMNLDQALEPAYLEVNGLKVAIVSWNEVPGPTHAGPTTPGVAWLNEPNVKEAVRRAKAADADLIVCDPQWWGGDEYHPDLHASQLKAVKWMDAAGCNQILAGGLHESGGVFLRMHANGVSMIDAGTGNFMYGQDFWQTTQEGVVIEQTFVGSRLVNVRLHPYVMILAARAGLLDPEGDGHYVLQRIWKYSDLDYRP
jgi:hypothetical protein